MFDFLYFNVKICIKIISFQYDNYMIMFQIYYKNV
jgi:hypothetical protein